MSWFIISRFISRHVTHLDERTHTRKAKQQGSGEMRACLLEVYRSRASLIFPYTCLSRDVTTHLRIHDENGLHAYLIYEVSLRDVV